jgi:hypothetical protein
MSVDVIKASTSSTVEKDGPVLHGINGINGISTVIYTRYEILPVPLTLNRQ